MEYQRDIKGVPEPRSNNYIDHAYTCPVMDVTD